MVLRFDPLAVDYEALRARVVGLLESRDWTSAPLPPGRRLWRIPVVLGGDEGPQFAEAARLAGLDAARARAAIATAQLRVLALGFAPGQPYMGELPEAWDIPRQSGLTPKVPGGALVVAIRQLIIFRRSGADRLAADRADRVSLLSSRCRGPDCTATGRRSELSADQR